MKINDYLNAISSYSEVMNKAPEMEVGHKLNICLFMIGDREKIMQNFYEMLEI